MYDKKMSSTKCYSFSISKRDENCKVIQIEFHNHFHEQQTAFGSRQSHPEHTYTQRTRFYRGIFFLLLFSVIHFEIRSEIEYSTRIYIIIG